MYMYLFTYPVHLFKLHVTPTTCSLLIRALADAEDFMVKNEGLSIRRQVHSYLSSLGEISSQDMGALSSAGGSFRASPLPFNPSGSKYLLRSLVSCVFVDLFFLLIIVLSGLSL